MRYTRGVQPPVKAPRSPGNAETSNQDAERQSHEDSVRAAIARCTGQGHRRKGESQGFKLTEKHIYTIRSNAKVAARKRAHRRRVTATPPATVTGKGVAAPAEHVLYAVAAQLGLDRAVELLQAQQSIVRSILAG